MKKITLNDFAAMTVSYQQYFFDYVLDFFEKIGLTNIDFWGGIPLKEYIETLERHDYSSIIDLEINDSIYWFDPHDAHKRSVDHLKMLLSE